jgi:predicted nucleic acid-binding protein
MQLVVDANVLFSAAIRDGGTAELLVRDDLDLHAPEFLFEEFRDYEATLLEKTHRDADDFQLFVSVLENRITTVPGTEFEGAIGRAKAVSPDPKDVAYFAVALHLDGRLWSDDGELGEQDAVPVVTTTELYRELE